jgi:cytochrome c oxidase cbb3-type subunit 3
LTSRRLSAWIVLAVAGIATAVLAAPPPAPPGFRLDGDAQRGRASFVKRCAICHGEAGDGRGKLAAGLDPKPTDFTAPGALAGHSDWEIYLAVRDGGQAVGLSPKMLGWGKLLSDREIRDAAAYVRSLAAGS